MIHIAQAPPPIPTPVFDLTAAGALVMTVSVGVVTVLFVWCIWRVTRESSPDKLHSPIDIEPPDEAADRRERGQ
jgi:heme/copper-type cytochrome/quinol oxidase subunit 2